MNDIKARIGKRIKEVRLAKGLTQEEAGKKLNLTKSVFSNYEAGRQNFSVELLEKIAQMLEVDIVELMK